jgi:hypothetical protein
MYQIETDSFTLTLQEYFKNFYFSNYVFFLHLPHSDSPLGGQWYLPLWKGSIGDVGWKTPWSLRVQMSTHPKRHNIQHFKVNRYPYNILPIRQTDIPSGGAGCKANGPRPDHIAHNGRAFRTERNGNIFTILAFPSPLMWHFGCIFPCHIIVN